MAHDTMKNFINGIKLRFPFYFKNVRVLDFGSLDINGNNYSSKMLIMLV